MLYRVYDLGIGNFGLGFIEFGIVLGPDQICFCFGVLLFVKHKGKQLLLA
ncbi:hypothetical protein RchiOBHm_Chr2g0102241 [Rosa chinensis]|uniref:Uncharacterized protein n=1 Tax=Rosa chinensis TaxID=74649 RepID=A0A2P6RML1_ROSCH|nr:hypothetical protein RchiOBHm_Chr2g0102241 [Rosa chinensis]